MSKEGEVHLDTHADFTGASTSINLEQERSIDCPHPILPPSDPSSNSEENPTSEEKPSAAVITEGDESMPKIITITAFEFTTPASTQSSAANVTGLEIVPWKRVLDVLAMQLWPIVIESCHAPRTQVSVNSAGSVIILGGEE
jgi:hypothetical protein